MEINLENERVGDGNIFFPSWSPIAGCMWTFILPVPAGSAAREDLPVQVGCPIEVNYGTGLKDTITDKLHRTVPHPGHGIDSAHSLSSYSVVFLHNFLAEEGVADPLIPTSYSDTALKTELLISSEGFLLSFSMTVS